MRVLAADGLRGFAALNVVLAHFVAAFYPLLLEFNYPGIGGDHPNVYSPVERILSSPALTLVFNGHFAVMTFFVLSGFVLSKTSLGEKRIEIIRGRAIARYFRLNLPILVVCLLSWVFLHFKIYSNDIAATISKSLWLTSFFVESPSFWEAINTGVVKGIFLGDQTLIPPLWTLRLEFFGSLMLLASLALAPDKNKFMFLCMPVVIIFIVFPDDYLYYLCFFSGAMIGTFFLKSRQAIIFGLIGIVFGAFQYDNKFYGMFPQLETPTLTKSLYNGIGAFFLISGVVHGFASSILSGPFAQWLGRISYSLYLSHFLVLCSAASWMVIWLGVGPLALAATLAVYLGITFALASFITRIVDIPSVKFARWFARRMEGSSKTASSPAPRLQPGPPEGSIPL